MSGRSAILEVAVAVDVQGALVATERFD